MLRRPGRSRAVGAGLLSIVLATSGCASAHPSHAPSSSTRATGASRPATATPAMTSAATSPSAAASTAAPSTASPSTAADGRAAAAIARRTGYLGRGGVSIEAVNLDSGRTFAYGAHGGMLCGSIAKLYILETLLLQHQRSGEPINDDETDDLATAMIENSDNDAANDLYVDIGEGRALRRAAAALGVEHTTPGPGIYWGFSATSASDFVALLRNLVRPGPLDRASRRYALNLMSHVESDQRWGVGTVADDDTTVYLKNGWLGADPDGGRWLVNTVGIVTVHGQRVLMAVLTQHGRDFDSGVDLVDRLAQITARAVTAD